MTAFKRTFLIRGLLNEGLLLFSLWNRATGSCEKVPINLKKPVGIAFPTDYFYVYFLARSYGERPWRRFCYLLIAADELIKAIFSFVFYWVYYKQTIILFALAVSHVQEQFTCNIQKNLTEYFLAWKLWKHHWNTLIQNTIQIVRYTLSATTNLLACTEVHSCVCCA